MSLESLKICNGSMSLLMIEFQSKILVKMPANLCLEDAEIHGSFGYQSLRKPTPNCMDATRILSPATAMKVSRSLPASSLKRF